MEWQEIHIFDMGEWNGWKNMVNVCESKILAAKRNGREKNRDVIVNCE